MATLVRPTASTDAEERSRIFVSFVSALPYIFVIAILIAAAAVFVQLQLPAVYTSKATVVPAALAGSPSDSPVPNGVGSPFDAQIQLLRSRDLARRVVARFNLAALPEYGEGTDLVARLAHLLTRLGLARSPSDATVEQRTLIAFDENLAVTSIAGGAGMEIAFSSTDPALAAAVADAVAAEVTGMQRATGDRTSAAELRRLSSEVADAQKEVRAAETAIAAFRKAHDLFTEGGQAARTLAEARLADLNAELSKARAVRMMAEAAAEQLRESADAAGGTIPPNRDILETPMIQWLSGKQITLKREIADASTILEADDARLTDLERQLAAVDEQIAAEIERRAAAAEADAELAKSTEARLAASIEEAKAEVAANDEAAIALRALEREAADSRRKLEESEQRHRDAVARREAETTPAARVAIAARVPSLPNVRPIAPTAGAAALVAGLACVVVVLLRVWFRRRRSGGTTPDDAVPVVPDAVPVEGRWRWADDHGGRRMMRADPTLAPSAGGEPDRSLVAIADRIVASDYRRVLVTSAESACHRGRLLAAVALARTLAGAERRVVVVDLRVDGAVEMVMGDGGRLAGFGDLLAGSASFAQVIFRDRASRAHFIPAGQHALVDASGDRIAALLSALDHTYDHVLVDVGDDLAGMLAPAARAGVVVTEFAAADPRTVRAVDHLKAVSSAVVLVLAVDPPPRRRSATDADDLEAVGVAA